MTKEEIISKIKSLDRRLDYDDEKECFISLDRIEIKAEWSKILSIEEKLKDYDCNDNSIKNDNYYEVLASFQNDRIFRDEQYTVQSDNFYISMGELSDEFVMFLFTKLEKKNVRFLRMYHRMTDDELNLLSLIKSFFKSYVSIKIKTKDLIENINEVINSYLFNLAYKKDVYVVLNSSLKDYSNRYKDFRRENNELDVPRRVYNETLTKYYIYASSTMVVSTKYLTYYNVLEYFFVDVYEEDICKRLQSIITSPDFVYKNIQHYKKILKEIPKTYKKNNSIDELDALKLTLKKFVNIDEIKQFVNSKEYKFDEENILSKSKKDILNLDETEEQIISTIANRIYFIRNAIVHSKNDGVNVSYIPLKHDDFLDKEVVLIKFIAERVIIASSKLL